MDIFDKLNFIKEQKKIKDKNQEWNEKRQANLLKTFKDNFKKLREMMEGTEYDFHFKYRFTTYLIDNYYGLLRENGCGNIYVDCGYYDYVNNNYLLKRYEQIYNAARKSIRKYIEKTYEKYVHKSKPDLSQLNFDRTNGFYCPTCGKKHK